MNIYNDNLSGVFNLLEKLVSIPSVNPSCGGPDEIAKGYCGEKKLADFICAWAKRFGLKYETLEPLPGRFSLIVKLPASINPETSPTIAYFAHLDTVWTSAIKDPFNLRREGNLVRGLGACDDKAALCSIMLAIEELAKNKSRPVNLIFAGTADEESGMMGIKQLVPTVLKPDAAIVGEPTSMNLVTAHKGVVRWEVETLGVSVHSSLVPQGKNAIYAGASLVKAAEKHAADIFAHNGHPLLGKKTLNVGTIRGGRQFNSVPDYCVLQIDRRLIPEETPDEAERIFKAELMKSGEEFKLKRVFEEASFDMKPSHPWVEYFYGKIREYKKNAELAGMACATEAARLGAFSVPTVIFGAGELAKAHSMDESVSLDEILIAKDIVISAVMGYNI